MNKAVWNKERHQGTGLKGGIGWGHPIERVEVGILHVNENKKDGQDFRGRKSKAEVGILRADMEGLEAKIVTHLCTVMTGLQLVGMRNNVVLRDGIGSGRDKSNTEGVI